MNIAIFRIVLLLCSAEIMKCLQKSTINRFSIKKQQLKINRMQSSTSSSLSDRIESVKVAITSGIAGTIVSSPFSLITGIISQFDSDWQVKHVSLFFSLFLFGITYRYAVRKDENSNLKQGVIVAFALTRALAMVDAYSSCSIFAHDCGIIIIIYYNACIIRFSILYLHF